MSTVRETRSGRTGKAKKEGGGDLPGAWASYGRLLQHLRKRAGLNQQQLGEATDWFKSSYSGSDGGDCVEVAAGLDAVYVRDSKVADDGPVLRVGRDEWAAFMALTAG
ncbi:hypothetical protein SUDANB66_00623 [Streptomyces sp. SudanB66_2053]